MKNLGQLYCFNFDYYLVRDEKSKTFCPFKFSGRHKAKNFGIAKNLRFTGDIDENVIDIETDISAGNICKNTIGMSKKQLKSYLCKPLS